MGRFLSQNSARTRVRLYNSPTVRAPPLHATPLPTKICASLTLVPALAVFGAAVGVGFLAGGALAEALAALVGVFLSVEVARRTNTKWFVVDCRSSNAYSPSFPVKAVYVHPGATRVILREVKATKQVSVWLLFGLVLELV